MVDINKNLENNPTLTSNQDSPTASINRPAVTTPLSTELSQDSRNMALLNWLGCLFFGLIPPLVLYIVKKDDAYVQEQAKEGLIWSITLIIGYIALWLLAIVLGIISFGVLAVIPMLLMVILSFAHLVFCVMGAMKASSGENFKVPFNIRLIK